MAELTNWAGNYQYRAAQIRRPSSVAELQEIIGRSNRVRALGTRHSFNDIADTEGDLISTQFLNKIIELDWQNSTVTVEGGIRYGELCRYLETEGYAIHNLASLPHISVAGAIATATHGSGIKNGCLSTAAVGVDMVTANGEIVSFAKGEETFNGVVVGLGALGIVARFKLSIRPSFIVRQNVSEDLPYEEVVNRFDEFMSSGYSVSLFTDWQGEYVSQMWLKSLDTEIEPTSTAGSPAPEKRHPIRAKSPVNCTEQMNVPGPWSERLPHFRLEYTPSSGEELQSEYLLPRECAAQAMRAIRGLRSLLQPLLQISEIRTVAADDLWMSPCYERDCVAIHFTWVRNWAGVSAILPIVEASLAPFDPRPHWGKLFHGVPAYPRMANFLSLAEELDPEGKFRNDFQDRLMNT